MTDLASRLRRVGEFYAIVALSIFFLLMFFQIPVIRVLGISSQVDELLLLTFLILIAISAIKNDDARKVITLLAIGYFVLLSLSISAIPARGLFNVLFQIFIHLKLLILFGFIWVFFGPKNTQKLLIAVTIVTVLGLLINLGTGSLFNQIFDSTVTTRGGLVRPIGFQADTASLGTTLALLSIFFITVLARGTDRAKVIWMFIFTVLVFLSTSRTSLIAIVIMMSWMLKDSVRTFLVILSLMIVSAVFLPSNKYFQELVNITRQNIEWTVDNPVESAYIRGIMIYFSFEIANENFPKGTGAATYGTVTSDDSFVYSDIGLRNSRFFVEKDGIYDSNFASILGEFGYAGMLFYYFLLFKMMTLFRNKESSQTTIWAQSGESQYSIALTAIAFSVSTPLFMNSYPAFILALIIVGSYVPAKKKTQSKVTI